MLLVSDSENAKWSPPGIMPVGVLSRKISALDAKLYPVGTQSKFSLPEILTTPSFPRVAVKEPAWATLIKTKVRNRKKLRCLY